MARVIGELDSLACVGLAIDPTDARAAKHPADQRQYVNRYRGFHSSRQELPLSEDRRPLLCRPTLPDSPRSHRTATVRETEPQLDGYTGEARLVFFPASPRP